MTVTTSLKTAPSPIPPKTSKPLGLLDIDPLELARQLTIIESHHYRSITSMECLRRWREANPDYKDNITNVIQNFNRVGLGTFNIFTYRPLEILVADRVLDSRLCIGEGGREKKSPGYKALHQCCRRGFFLRYPGPGVLILWIAEMSAPS